jgi:hypothetical protein
MWYLPSELARQAAQRNQVIRLSKMQEGVRERSFFVVQKMLIYQGDVEIKIKRRIEYCFHKPCKMT